MELKIESFHGRYRWLSNFWPCTVVLDGHKYKSVEFAYVAAKTLDSDQRAMVRRLTTPGQAKRLGRTFVLRPGWYGMKLAIMEDLLRQKFSPKNPLGTRLVLTGNCPLIEGNTWGDTFWGVCKGQGENHLGRLLMKIRDEK